MQLVELISPYSRNARLYPALLSIFPALVLVPAIYGFESASIVSIAGVCGVGYLLTRIARNLGARLQDELWHKWGGPPAAQLLRHRDTQIDRYTKARYHAALARLTGLDLPTADQESADPDDAEERYRAVSRRLIELTRDRKSFPLLFNENAAYGFHRNGLGLRPLGILIAIACIVVVLLHSNAISITPMAWNSSALLSMPRPSALSIAVAMISLFMWIGAFTETAVKRAAFAYASRLLETSDQLAATHGAQA